RLIGLQAVDQRHEQPDLFLEPIDGLELDISRGHLRHALNPRVRSRPASPPLPGAGRPNGSQRRTAPYSRPSAPTIASTLACTSASVSVRSSAWKVIRTDRLTDPSGIPWPWYRSKNVTLVSGAGVVAPTA